jgi:tetratricopeptide (TPR) repeat protein/4-amino-4-deoxy-L-arabinose transferase-like glycosyltransferase
MPPARFALIIIVLLAALPRVLMLGGVDSIWHPDEFYFVYKPLGFFGGDLNPHLFNYPSLSFYLTALLYGVVFVWQQLFGAGMSLDEWVLYHYFWHPEELLPLARFLALSFALGTIYLTGLIAEKLTDARTGLVAALLASLSIIHLRQSPLAAVDLPMCFWLLAALYFSLRLVEENRLRFYLLAGICTGLAASSKYPGALVGAAVFSAHILGATALSLRALAARFAAGRLWLAALVSLLSFVCTSPYVLIDFATFWQYFARELAHAASGHGADLGTGWWYHLATTLRYNLGWLGLVGLAAGLCVVLKRPTRLTWVLLATWLVFYLAIGSSRTVFVRYALPLCLLQAIFCALVFYHLGRWRWSLLLLSLLLVEPLYASQRLVQIVSGQDTRLQARRWIEEHVPAGSTLCNFGGWYGDVPLRTFEQVWWQLWNYENAYPELAKSAKADSRLPRALLAQLDFLEDTRPRAPYYSYIIDSGNHPDERGSLRAIGDHDCDCVVLHRHPLSYSSIDSTFYTALKERGTLLASFVPTGLAAAHPTYDPIDAYYVPIGDFGELKMPGPAVEIWRLKPEEIGNYPRSASQLFAQGYAIGSSVRLVQKRPAEAYAMNTRALALDAANGEALLTRALLYREKGDRQEAMRLLRAVLEREPQQATALYNLALLAEQGAELNAAADAFTRFIALRPDYAPAYRELGVVRYRQRQYQQALEMAERGLALAPDEPGFYYNMALAHIGLGQTERAVSILERRLQDAPRDAHAHFLLGNSYAALGRRNSARLHYEQMLELDPAHPRAPSIRLLLQSF